MQLNWLEWKMNVSTRAACIICVLEDVYTAADTIHLDEADKQRLVKETLAMLSREPSKEQVPSVYITEAHRILKKVARRKDPFEKERRLCNEVGMSIAERVDSQLEAINGKYERFNFLAKWAITGNLIDIRTAGTSYTLTRDDLYNQLLETFNEKFAVDELKKIFELTKSPKKILYILDNVGEIALDRLFIRELKGYGNSITAAARGGPMTSDATPKDLSFVGIDKVVDKVITTGPDTLGLSLAEASEGFLKEIKDADVIIGKGQANFYNLSTYRPKFAGDVVALFRTKCDYISSFFGKTGKMRLAMLIPR